MTTTPKKIHPVLSRLSAVELVNEILSRGIMSIDEMFREVGVSSMDELLQRFQPTN